MVVGEYFGPERRSHFLFFPFGGVEIRIRIFLPKIKYLSGISFTLKY